MSITTPHTGAELDALARLLRGRAVVALAGAGISTESGIPDYRGPQGSHRKGKPMQYGEFIRSDEGRRRYWSRSVVGWNRVARAQPNQGHTALASMEERGALAGVITQNVDGLHQAAGNTRVVELHGSLAYVRCLDCDDRITRESFQERLRSANPAWLTTTEGAQSGALQPAPDGDAHVPASASKGFTVPGCRRCGGLMKPDVVFFGESVPKPSVEAAWELFDKADALLVVGSSLMVYSGRRFVYRAVERGVDVGIVNLGPTRADESAAVKVEGALGEVLPELVARL